MVQAQQEAKLSQKPIFLVFVQGDLVRSSVYPSLLHPIIQRSISEGFIPVLYTVDSPQRFTFYGRHFGEKSINPLHDSFIRFMGVSSLPTVMFLDKNWHQITSVMGGVSARDLEPYLAMVSSGQYLGIKNHPDWKTYLNKFRYRVKQD